MKYAMLFSEGFQESEALDSLAARGRIGILDFGKTTEKDQMLLKLFGCLDRLSYPGKACIEALAAGLAPDTNTLCLGCRAASLDKEGNIGGLVRDERELEGLAEAISSMEIDGVKFKARRLAGGISILAAGEGLYPRLSPCCASPGTALPQACASGMEGKRAASVLNKAIYRLVKARGKGLVIDSQSSFSEHLGFKAIYDIDACLVSSFRLAPGISAYLGIDHAESSGPEAAEAALASHGLVLAEVPLASLQKAAPWLARRADALLVVVLWDGHKAFAIIGGGGVLPGREKRFSRASCSRGFSMPAESFLPWILRATRQQAAAK